MVDIDGMVGRLMQLMKDTHAASALRGGSEHGGTEVVLAYHLRTTEREQDAARLDLLKALAFKRA